MNQPPLTVLRVIAHPRQLLLVLLDGFLEDLFHDILRIHPGGLHSRLLRQVPSRGFHNPRRGHDTRDVAHTHRGT